MEYQGFARFVWIWRSFPLQPSSWLSFEAQLVERLRFYVEEYFNVDAKYWGFEICLFVPDRSFSQFQTISWRNTNVIPVDENFSMESGAKDASRPIIRQALSLEGLQVVFMAAGDVEESLTFLMGRQIKSVLFSPCDDIDRDVSYSSSLRIVPWLKISRLADISVTNEFPPSGVPESAGVVSTTEDSSLLPIGRETDFAQVALDLRMLVIANYFECLLRWHQPSSLHSSFHCQFFFGEDPNLYSTFSPAEMKSSISIDKDPVLRRYELILRGVSRAFVNMRARVLQDLIVNVINLRQVKQLVGWDAQHRLAIVGSSFLLDREENFQANVSVHVTSNGVFAEVLGLNISVVEKLVGVLLSLRPSRDNMRLPRSLLSFLDKKLVEDIHVRCTAYLEVIENSADRLSMYDESCEIAIWGFDEMLDKTRSYLMNIIPPVGSSPHHSRLGLSTVTSSFPQGFDPLAPRQSSSMQYRERDESSVFSRGSGSGASSMLPGLNASDVHASVSFSVPGIDTNLDYFPASVSDAHNARSRYPSSVSYQGEGLSHEVDNYGGGAHNPRSVSGMSPSSTISSLTTRKEAIRKIHRGIYSFADREAGIFFFAFEQQFREFLEKSFQVLVEDTESGLDMRQPNRIAGMTQNLGYNNSGSYDAEPGNKNIVLKVSFYGNTPKRVAAVRTYLEQLNTTNLMRTQIYFPQVSTKKYKEILNKRASQSTILNNVRLREACQLNPIDATMSVIDPLRSKGFINIRVKPPMHLQGTKRSSQLSDVTVTISGSLLTEGNEQLIKDLESEFMAIDDEYIYQVVQIPYSHPMKRQLTIKSLREEIIQRHGLVALKWEEGCRANGSVGTAKIWARNQPSMETILQAIRNAESLHLDAPALMGSVTDGRSPISVELEQDITKDIVAVLDINRTILSLTKLDLISSLENDQQLDNEQNSDMFASSFFNSAASRLSGVSRQAHMAVSNGVNGDFKIVIYLPDLTLRYVLLGPPLSQMMTDMLARFSKEGIKSKYPYRDRTDPHAALLLEGETISTTRAATEASRLITSATQELKSVHVVVSDGQHEALLASDLALIKYIQGQAGVHLKLDPNIQDAERVTTLVDLRFHYKPISVDSVAERTIRSDSHPWNTLPTIALSRGLLISTQWKMVQPSSVAPLEPMEVSVFGAAYGSSGWINKVDTVVSFTFDGDDEDSTHEFDLTYPATQVKRPAVFVKSEDVYDVKIDESFGDNDGADKTSIPSHEDFADMRNSLDIVAPVKKVEEGEELSPFNSYISLHVDQMSGKRKIVVRLSVKGATCQNTNPHTGDQSNINSMMAVVASQVIEALVFYKSKQFAFCLPSEAKLKSFFCSFPQSSKESISSTGFFESILSSTQQKWMHDSAASFSRLVAVQEVNPEESVQSTTTFTLPESRHFPSSLDSGAQDVLAQVLIRQFENQESGLWYDSGNSSLGDHSESPRHRSNTGEYRIGGGLDITVNFGVIGDSSEDLTVGATPSLATSAQVKMELLVCNVPLSTTSLSHLMSAAPAFNHGVKTFILKGLLPGVLSALDLLRAIVSPAALVMKAAVTATTSNIASSRSTLNNNIFSSFDHPSAPAVLTFGEDSQLPASQGLFGNKSKGVYYNVSAPGLGVSADNQIDAFSGSGFGVVAGSNQRRGHNNSLFGNTSIGINTQFGYNQINSFAHHRSSYTTPTSAPYGYEINNAHPSKSAVSSHHQSPSTFSNPMNSHSQRNRSYHNMQSGYYGYGGPNIL
jgi:hypothetical protein